MYANVAVRGLSIYRDSSWLCYSRRAGVCTDPLKLRPIALSTAMYRFFAKILERRLRASLGLLHPGDPDATMSSAQAGSRPGMAVDDVLAVFRLALERAAVRNAPPLCILILDWAKYYDRIPAWLVAEVFLAHGIHSWHHAHRYITFFTETDGFSNILWSLSRIQTSQWSFSRMSVGRGWQQFLFRTALVEPSIK